ncbi:hypothetical protein M9H77_02424 [Catharanthus roseus]|uniref:Uncharacterized protein n=1 Tax=Catharanthus roseus TaxID=4058 RepID=A0ACC0C8J9_CATRO|nr:hypothetical protein M9H77_02424 [Catharanthus roseus]
MSYSLTPPRSSDAGKEDTDATGGIGVGDAAAGIVFATEVPILPVTAGVPCSGSGVISESDVGSLGSSSLMFQVLFPVPLLVPSLVLLLTHHRKGQSLELVPFLG